MNSTLFWVVQHFVYANCNKAPRDSYQIAYLRCHKHLGEWVYKNVSLVE